MAARARRSDDRWADDRHRGRGSRAETGFPGRDPGHGHSHGHGPAEPAPRRLRVLMASLLAPLAMAAVIGMILLWPATPHAQSVGGNRVWVGGTVTATQIAT